MSDRLARENEAVERWRADDQRAAETIVQKYESQVAALARSLALGDKDIADDLKWTGLLALLTEARERFDETRGKSLLAYAQSAVHGAMVRRLDELSPVSLPKMFARIRRYRRQLEQELGREVTSLEVAERLGRPVHVIETALATGRVSLYDNVGADSDTDVEPSDEPDVWPTFPTPDETRSTTSDVDPLDERPDEQARWAEPRRMYAECMAALTDQRMRTIFELRYGRLVLEGSPLTLEHAAREMGIKPEDARAFEMRAMDIVEGLGLLRPRASDDR